MTNKVKSIPEGYHSVTPYLTIDGADKAIEFYKKAFGATVKSRMEMGKNKVGHAVLQIGDSKIMLSDVFPGSPHKDAKAIGDSPMGICLYVDDVDTVFKKALDAGAKVDQKGELQDQFWGDRSGSLIDPFGHRWMIQTHKEDVSDAEMQKRLDKMMKEFQQGREAEMQTK